MTYNEIIDVFKKKVQGHFFINEFGYGDISDISTPDDGKAPYYPYIFLNPVSVTSNDRVSTFNFNLICMTQCRDDQYQIIKKQSDCIDNLRDIIAQVNNTLIDPLVEIQSNYTFTPFKERFQDDVVGASCNITVTYPSQLDACNVPIADPDYCLIADTFNNTTAPEFNTTYTFGGWGYFKYTKEEFNETANPDDEYFEFVCDTRYAWFISTEKKTILGGDQLYPVMAYIDTGYPTSDSDRLSAFYIFTKKDGQSFECGSKSSLYYNNADLNAVSYVNTTSDNGWVIPTEGWVKTFDADDSADRSGNVYIFQTECTNPKPSPTAAPLPPPSNTPTPTVSTSPTPTQTVTATVTPTVTPSVTTTVTPTTTATPSISVTPTISTSLEPSVTATPTVTPTTTPSLTQTPSVTTTPSVTATNSVTPTASVTTIPSVTATPTVTATPSVTSTVTPSITASFTPTPTPSVETCHIEAQNGDLIIAQNGDFIDHFPCIEPTPTPTTSVTPTNSVTPTITPTPTASVPAGDADANAYIAAIIASGGTTDTTIENAIQTLFTDLKSAGVYSKMLAFYPVVGGVAASHAINAKRDTTYDLTFVGGWTHGTSGMTSNGSTAYANTQATPQDLGTNGTGYDNHHLLITVNDNTIRGYEGAGPGGNGYMITRSQGSEYFSNGSIIQVGIQYDNVGQQILNRTAVNSMHGQYQASGGTITKTVVRTNTASNITTGDIWIGGVSNTSFKTSNRYIFQSIGDGLTDTEVSDLFAAINTFNGSLGRRGY